MTIKSISPDAVRKYCDFGTDSPLSKKLAVIVRLIDWLEEEKLTSDVFFSIGLSGFLVSDRPDFTWEENMLRIDAVRSPDFVVFEYYRIYGSTDIDRKHCPREDVVECLREFLAYKFGIHRPQKKPNQPPEPMAALRTAMAHH